MGRLEQLLELHSEFPQDAFTHYSLAIEYANAGQAETAVAELRKLIAAKPDYVPAYQMLAQTLVKQGQNDAARAAFDNGIAAATKAGNLHAASEMRGMMEEL